MSFAACMPTYVVADMLSKKQKVNTKVPFIRRDWSTTIGGDDQLVMVVYLVTVVV